MQGLRLAWCHNVVLESVCPAPAGVKLPLCRPGVGAFCYVIDLIGIDLQIRQRGPCLLGCVVRFRRLPSLAHIPDCLGARVSSAGACLCSCRVFVPCLSPSPFSPCPRRCSAESKRGKGVVKGKCCALHQVNLHMRHLPCCCTHTTFRGQERLMLHSEQVQAMWFFPFSCTSSSAAKSYPSRPHILSHPAVLARSWGPCVFLCRLLSLLSLLSPARFTIN